MKLSRDFFFFEMQSIMTQAFRNLYMTTRDVYQIRFSNTPFPIAALFDFREKLAISRNRKVFDTWRSILQ